MTYRMNQPEINRKDFNVYPGMKQKLSIAIEPFGETDELRTVAWSRLTKAQTLFDTVQAGYNAGYVNITVPWVDGIMEPLGWNYQLQKRPAGGSETDWEIVAFGVMSAKQVKFDAA